MIRDLISSALTSVILDILPMLALVLVMLVLWTTVEPVLQQLIAQNVTNLFFIPLLLIIHVLVLLNTRCWTLEFVFLIIPKVPVIIGLTFTFIMEHVPTLVTQDSSLILTK